MLLIIKNSFLTFVLLILYGCISVKQAWDTLEAVSGIGEGKNAVLSPGIEYLKVKVNEHQYTMSLGYRTFPNPNAEQNIIFKGNETSRDQLVKNAKLYSPDNEVHEFWYSGQREIIELVNGRIVSVDGIDMNWKQINSTAPSWDLIFTSAQISWIRNRDLMPANKLILKDKVLTRLIKVPPKQAKELGGNSVWYEDDIASKNLDGSNWNYKQLFAVTDGRVTYSEQCISQNFCLSLKYIGTIAHQ
jgi:hypothetical protein